jgi:hypothetical protein
MMERNPMASLPDLTEIEPLGEADRTCLEELRAVLERHGNLDRFGVTLLHDHFAIAPDERMMETCDLETRTLTITPERIDTNHSVGCIVETSWRFTRDTQLVAGLVCRVGCFVDLKDNHKRTHQRVNG